jgi:hypothetical protein
MLAKLLVGKLVKATVKKMLSEKLKIKLLCMLGDIIVKSTKNKLDDKIWKKVKHMLEKK